MTELNTAILKKSLILLEEISDKVGRRKNDNELQSLMDSLKESYMVIQEALQSIASVLKMPNDPIIIEKPVMPERQPLDIDLEVTERDDNGRIKNVKIKEVF